MQANVNTIMQGHSNIQLPPRGPEHCGYFASLYITEILLQLLMDGYFYNLQLYSPLV